MKRPSISTTLAPERASSSAALRPVIPPPTTHTSACTSSRSAGRGARSTVSSQSEARVGMHCSSPTSRCSNHQRGHKRGVRARVSFVLMLVFLGGCGSSSEPSAVAGRFQKALNVRDGAGACAQLSSQTASKLEDQEHKPCERAILGLGLPHGQVASSQVYVTSAAVSLA